MKNKQLVKKIFDVIEMAFILMMTAAFIYNLLIDNYEMAILLLLALNFGTVVDGFKREAELSKIMFEYMDLMCKMQLEDLRINDAPLKDIPLKDKSNNKKKEKNNDKKVVNTK